MAVYDGRHDACVAIADDFQVLVSVEAERILRRKHAGFNDLAEFNLVVGSALAAVNMSISDVAVVYLSAWRHLFRDATELAILGRNFQVEVTRHHAAHVGTAVPIGLGSYLVLCADGGSEDGFCHLYQVTNGSVESVANFDDRICSGLFYGTVTQLVIDPDFERAHSEAPGKLMALSAYGEYDDDLATRLLELQDEICRHHFSGVGRLRDILSLSPDYRSPEKDRLRCNLARTAQDLWINDLCTALKPYSNKDLALALTGGCALNVVANSALENTGYFSDIWVPPVASDSGQAIGSLLYHHPELRCEYPFLGRDFGESMSTSIEIASQVVSDIAAGHVIGWYEGRSECGPRALCHRSLLASPTAPENRYRVSVRMKGRENYRPLAPVVLEGEVSRYFVGPRSSPYMTFAYDVLPNAKALIPAIVHVDGTARVQTLNQSTSATLCAALSMLGANDQPIVLINTSMNGPAEPIVDSPEDALVCCKRMGAEILYVNGSRIALP